VALLHRPDPIAAVQAVLIKQEWQMPVASPCHAVKCAFYKCAFYDRYFDLDTITGGSDLQANSAGTGLHEQWQTQSIAAKTLLLSPPQNRMHKLA